MNRVRFLILSSAFALTLQAHAVTVAVVDSGTDLSHNELKDHAWVNPKEQVANNRDDDGNGKVDDINGWNFAEKNNQIIDMSYLGTFSPDPKKFFELQLKSFKGTITAEEKEWVNQKRNDAAFIAEIGKFGNFVHGTHVAGIASKDYDATKIMGVKLIPTEVKKPGGKGGELFLNTFNTTIKNSTAAAPSGIDKEKLIEMAIYKGLDALAGAQGKNMEPIGLYLWFHKVKVANCSFGTSTHAFSGVLKQLLQAILKREPSEEELMKYSKYFVTKVIEQGKQFTIDAKDTLFVIAAGNDGMNNEEFPTFPANLKRPNTISVAATFGHAKIANFSNYGAAMVDVAAPGVGINSSIPGNEYLTVSGTSQASPYVANVAARILDINPSLKFADVKKILMQTSDMKDFLAGKVASGGIVNPDRASKAAMLSMEKSLDDAIVESKILVSDIEDKGSVHGLSDDEINSSSIDEEGLVLPLPGVIQ